MKKLSVLLVVLLVLAGCQANQGTSTDTLKVVTSFYPLYDFATKVGGEHVEVTNIIPAGTEAHDFEPTAQDIVNLESADVFIYHGAGFESWTEKVLGSLSTTTLKVVEASHDLTLLPATEEHDHEEEEEEADHEEDHDHGIYDPHTWLDPVLAKQEMKAIYDALVEVDPDNEATYTENYEKYAQEFDVLNEEFETALHDADHHTLVVDHLAYSYLANRYHLEQLSVTGGIINSEPTAQQIETTIAFIKENNVKAIYIEAFSNANVLQVISAETGATILSLNTLESLSQSDLDEGRDYFSIMRENLENIVKGL